VKGFGFDGQLSLDSELREQLELEEHESLRVLHEAGRVLTLERTGGDRGTAVPWNRDLVLTADVHAFPMADLLKFVHSSGKSGFVLFADGDHEKSVYINRGEVVFATSNQRVDRIGESLLRNGSVTLEQLHEADRRWSPSERFGKVLVELGVLTPRDLWNAVKVQVEDVVRSLFAYTKGTFHFWEGEVQPDNIVRLSLPTRRLIAEGLKKRDELLRFLAVLEDPRTRLAPVEGMTQRLSGTERSILDALGSEGRFQTVCHRVGLDPLSAARTVHLLSLVGAIKLRREESADGGAGEGEPHAHDEEVVRECVYDHVKLIGELAAPIVAVDGAAALEERLAPVLEDAAARHGAALAGIELGPGCALDPEALVARGLRLTGDRVRGVSDALGELVTYLEFELRNHPKIDGAESFLEAVEGLRAKLVR